jgi:hypothetical protein
VSARFLDLATRPFANVRPLRRVAIALWVLGVGLAIANTQLYLRSFSGLESTQNDLAKIQQQISELEDSVESTTTALRAMDLGTQNEQVQFLNERIAERTFGWGRLFDRLGEVLPDQVRLTRLSPKVMGGEESGRRRARNTPRSQPSADPNRVHLQMTGTAEGDEALLDFIDRLYDDPAFASPSLASESRDLGIQRTFTLSVSYLPHSGRDAALEGAEDPVVAASRPPGDADGDELVRGSGADDAARSAADDSRLGGTEATGGTPEVVDRSGAGRYYGADDPRSGGSRRRVPIRSTRTTARDRAAAASERTSNDTSPPGAAAVGGLQYVGGTARPDPSTVAPIPLGQTASGTGGIR